MTPGMTCGRMVRVMMRSQDAPLMTPVSSKRGETPSMKPFRIQTEKGMENIA